MRKDSVLVVLGALVLAVSGCAVTDATTGSVPSAPAADVLVGAAVDVWFGTNDDIRLCPHDIDPHFSMDEPSCPDEVRVTGITAADLRAQLAATGVQGRSIGDAEIVPAWVVGNFENGTLDLVSTDEERYPPERSTTPTPEPSPAPSFATGEEKEAYQRSIPMTQPEGCVAPTDGWSNMSGIGLFAADAYQNAHPDEVLGNVQTYVDNDTQIAIVAVAADTDAKAVRTDLAADYPGSLCVLPTNLTRADLEAVDADPVLNSADTVMSAGLRVPRQSFGEDPTPVFTSHVTILTQKVLDAAATHPEGLVNVIPWFEPVRDRGA